MRRYVEIGRQRERVEVLEEPLPGPDGRVGRIKHSNGENVDIDFETLQALIERAREPRETLFAA